MRYRLVPSPLGELALGVDEQGALTRLDFGPPSGVRDDRVADVAAAQLAEYFAGRRRVFELDLALGGTDFQRTVWTALLDIGCGETETYGHLAARIGRPTAVRAVGAAAGRNPIAIIVPCHRLVGAGDKLTGYAGGLDRKRWLLDLESAPDTRPLV